MAALLSTRVVLVVGVHCRSTTTWVATGSRAWLQVGWLDTANVCVQGGRTDASIYLTN